MKKIIIIDSNSVIHRAFHALPPLTAKDGEVVNAVYGFITFLFKSVRQFTPDYVAACFDVSKDSFRTALFNDYKANRKKAPQELYDQIPKIKEVLKAFNVRIFEKQGFEGDDLIATIAKIKNGGLQKIILSGDLDNLQMVDKDTKVFFLRKGISDTVFFGEEEVIKKYDGISPRQIIDLKALKGDASDNIPGVLGIGEKTAISLLKKYNDLESIYLNLDSIKGSVKEKLEKNKSNAFLSRELARMKTDVDIDFDLNECKWGNYDRVAVVKILESFGFKSLIPKIPNGGKGDNLKLF